MKYYYINEPFWRYGCLHLITRPCARSVKFAVSTTLSHVFPGRKMQHKWRNSVQHCTAQLPIHSEWSERWSCHRRQRLSLLLLYMWLSLIWSGSSCCFTAGCCMLITYQMSLKQRQWCSNKEETNTTVWRRRSVALPCHMSLQVNRPIADR